MDIWIFHGSFKFRLNFVDSSSKFRRHFVECVFIFLKFRQHFVEISSKCPVSGSPSRVRLCGGCLRRFGDLRKNTPLEFGSMYLVYFIDFLLILYDFKCFAGFRVSQPCASVWWLPAALRRPQKKHVPGILEHVSCGFHQIRRKNNGNSTKSYK